jgi:hypothetical protein
MALYYPPYVPFKMMKHDAWRNIREYQDYKDVFIINIPSQDAINKQYGNAFTYYRNQANKFQTLFKELGFNGTTQIDVTKQNRFAKFNVVKTVQDAISKAYIFKDMPSKSKTTEMIVDKTKAQEIVSRWEKVISTAQKKKWATANTQLESLQKYIDAVNAEMASNDVYVNISKALGKTNAYSTAMKVMGAVNGVKGASLEVELGKYIRKMLPKDYLVAQTGNIVHNNNKLGKADISIVLKDLKLTNVDHEISWYFDKKGNLKSKYGETSKKFEMTAQESVTEFKDAVLGISVKNTKGAINFHGGLNIGSELLGLINESGNSDVYLWQMFHQYQLGQQDTVKAYQSYMISKMIINIIGEENAIIAGPGYMIPTYYYIYALMKQGRKKTLRFSNVAVPDRDHHSNLNYASEFGTTDIIGTSVETLAK